MKMQNSAGFTLLELLLSVALIGILGGISLPVSQQFQNLTDLDVAASTVGQGLRRAQLLSQSVDGDATWGISIDDSDNNKIVLFRGASFASRDTAYDEEFELSSSITSSGVGEVIFAKLTGLPDTVGTATLTTNAGQSRAITINEKGTISY